MLLIELRLRHRPGLLREGAGPVGVAPAVVPVAFLVLALALALLVPSGGLWWLLLLLLQRPLLLLARRVRR